MYEACTWGELGICWYLLDQGAASWTKNTLDETHLLIACFGGCLHVAQWLFEMGAADNTRTKSNDGLLR